MANFNLFAISYEISVFVHRKLLTFLSFGCIMITEKGKTSNGYAKVDCKNNPNFGLWGLFFYCCYKCKQSDNIYHYVHIFHNSHLLSRPLINVIRDIRWWHNRPAFTLFLVLPFSSGFSDNPYYTTFYGKVQAFFHTHSHIIQHRADGIYGKAEHKKYPAKFVILRTFGQRIANA